MALRLSIQKTTAASIASPPIATGQLSGDPIEKCKGLGSYSMCSGKSYSRIFR
jgi:hypothetical protein